jgi:hypothetical protein
MDANTIISCVCAEKILDIYPSHVVGVSTIAIVFIIFLFFNISL